MSVMTHLKSKPFSIFISAIVLILMVKVESHRSELGLTYKEYWFGVEVPDFTAFETVTEKKQAFFDFFRPIAEQNNLRITDMRLDLLEIREQDSLSSRDEKFVRELANLYRVELSEALSKKDLDALLVKVDVLPVSLVLSQAAMESAWGTSRFAKEGYNYFGQWCFTQGCGMIPNSRSSGMKHEVQVFSTPHEAVKAYFLNLNRHPTYALLRAERQKARETGQPIHGCQLALGLENYSARGKHYINELRQMIRGNKLSPYGYESCANLAIASESQAHDSSESAQVDDKPPEEKLAAEG